MRIDDLLDAIVQPKPENQEARTDPVSERPSDPKDLAEAVRLIRQGYATKIYSEVIGAELWLVKDESTKAKLKTRSWYDGDAIYTLDEIHACAGLSPEALQELYRLKVQFDGTLSISDERSEERTLSPTPTDVRVRCKNCRHFVPDSIGDGSGIGSCKVDAKPTGPPLYPQALRYCDDFESRETDKDCIHGSLDKEGKNGN